MIISTDEVILFEKGFFHINYTILFTWIVMAILILLAIITSMNIKNKKSVGKFENFFEVLLNLIEDQIKSITKVEFKLVFPVISTIFLFILVSNLISLIPNFQSPTGSLSTTFALMFVVLIFAMLVGIKSKGYKQYFSKYVKPVAFMLPLNIIGDIVSNFSLAFRLYGNIMKLVELFQEDLDQ